MGRPTKLTRERADKITKAISGGSYQVVAAAAAGVSESAFYEWVKRGKDAPRDEDTGEPLNPDDAPFVEFAEAVKVAEAEAEMRNVLLIQQAGTTTWQAAAWYLERKHSDRWGRVDRVKQEISGTPGGEPVQVQQVDPREALLAFLSDHEEETAQDGPEQTGGDVPDGEGDS